MNRFVNRVVAVGFVIGGFIVPAFARTVSFDLNVYPETDSWEVVASVDGEGQDQDGLAGYYFQLTKNVTWFDQTPPLLTGTEVGVVGFDLTVAGPFDSHFEIVAGHGHTLSLPDGAGILFDVGNKPGGEVPEGATPRNVPWSHPVVLAVGGFDSSLGVIDFTEGGDPPFADANLFLRDDEGGYSIIRADGSVFDPNLQFIAEALSASSKSMLQAISELPIASAKQIEEPLNLVFSSFVRTGISGPQEGMVDEWLARGAIPEPATLSMLCLASLCLVATRRRC